MLFLLLRVFSGVLYRQLHHMEQSRFYFFLPNLCTFMSFSYYIVRTSSTVLNGRGERKPCPSQVIRKASSFSSLSLMLAISIVMVFLKKREFPSITRLLSYMNLGWYQTLFLFIIHFLALPFTSDISDF